MLDVLLFLFFLPSFICGAYGIVWGIPLVNCGLMFRLCPSQFLVYPQPTCCWGGMRSRKVFDTVFITNPKRITMQPTVKKCNCIPTKTIYVRIYIYTHTHIYVVLYTLSVLYYPWPLLNSYVSLFRGKSGVTQLPC